MSNSNFFLKPPVLLAALVLIGLIALSSSLKKQVEGPSRADGSEEQGEFDRLSTDGTRISRISAPSVSGRKEAAPRTGAVAQKQAPRKPVVEDFDMAMKRAEGDADISGRIYGAPAETDADRDARRQRFAEMMNATSGSLFGARDGGESWMRERMSRYKPVEGAEIALYEDDPNTTHPPLRTAVADKEGSFTLAKLNDANQRYILVVKSDKFAPEATFVNVNQESRNVDVYLQEGVPLKGKVLDAETSEPVAGAMVYYPNPNWGTFAPLGVTTTTISGEYNFAHVNPGRLLTQASAHGYATSRVRLHAPDENSTIELMPGGASISGVTIDRLTGKPQGGARVWAVSGYRVSESSISKDDGTFEIADLPEGEYDVYAVRGMKSEVQKIELKRRDSVDDVEIVLPASVLVSGQVLHATKREPLEGIKVWFDSSKGSQYRRTNADGRFAFETMAIDEYAIMIHEKGFLPVGDSKSSGAEEVITRKIAKNQSSDDLVIRLKPVRTLEGKVTRERGRGGFGGFFGGGGFGGGRDSGNGADTASANGGNNGGDVPARDADVTLSFVEGRDFTQLKTKSDAAGNFFFNLPETRRGEGIVVASQNFMLDGKDVRVPRNRPIELKLGRSIAMGELLLSDESSLDGVPVAASIVIPKRRADSDAGSAHEVTISQTNTMRGGRLFMGLPPNQDVQLAFSMPDGVVVKKSFKTNQLLRGSSIFVYDPVSQDIVTDTRSRENRFGNRGANGNRNRGNGNGGNEGGGGNRRGGNNGGNGGDGANGGNRGNPGNGGANGAGAQQQGAATNLMQ